MNRMGRYFVASTLVACVILMFVGSRPNDGNGGHNLTGFRADIVGQYEYAEKQILELEQAVPQEKFSWRPAEGVRSISEVYLHIAHGNYLLPTFTGAEIPADAGVTMDQKAWETSTTDRKKINEILKKSFDFVKTVVKNTPDEDLERKVKFFGQELTVRNMLMTVLAHQHEHLGQSVAYARTNGVVPPWTARAEAAAKAKKEYK